MEDIYTMYDLETYREEEALNATLQIREFVKKNIRDDGSLPLAAVVALDKVFGDYGFEYYWYETVRFFSNGCSNEDGSGEAHASMELALAAHNDSIQFILDKKEVVGVGVDLWVNYDKPEPIASIISMWKDRGYETYMAPAIEPVEPDEVEHGYAPGDICNRNECDGTMIDQRDGSCSCHTGHPPCGYCTACITECDECGYEVEEHA